MRLRYLIALSLILLLGGLLWVAYISDQNTKLERAPLRALAQDRGFRLGAAVAYQPLVSEAAYRDTLAREFNVVTPENAMKFDALHPSRDRYDFSQADAIVKFAQGHAMQVRGHPLLWHEQLPGWLTQGKFTSEELKAILKDHIQTTVSHYRGQVWAWDVVNEAFKDDGTLRDTLWLRGIGPEYVELTFRWAREADLNALLFYNDYANEGLNRKSDAIYNAVKELKQRGVPVDGVGWQMHISSSQPPDPQAMSANLQRLAELGLQVQITELDVKVQESSAPMEERLVQQAKVYGDTLAFCLSHQTCTALVMWGFTDRYTWIPGFTGKPDWPLIFDRNYQPKPAYDALRDTLAVKRRLWPFDFQGMAQTSYRRSYQVRRVR
jgi:endo-1,4-beta-xylanase